MPARRAGLLTLTAWAAAAFAVFPIQAHAIVVRGRLTNARGKPVARGQVKLMHGKTVATYAFSDAHGRYEIRFAQAGRFTLIGLGRGYTPAVVDEFYGGATEIIEKNVVLSLTEVRQEVSVTATGLPTPLPQLTAPVSLVKTEDLDLRTGVSDELRMQPGAFIVQTGQGVGVTSLFMRGGPSDGNKVVLDGVPLNDVGGGFDFGTVGSTGIDGIETYRGPDSVLYGTDAESSVVSFTTPRGRGTFPLFSYSGDAGNFHQVRNEVAVGGAISKLDYYGAFSRYNTSNALANDATHLITSVGNVGYRVLPRLTLRGIVRDSVVAQGLPGAYDFLGLTVLGRQQDHDLYAQGNLDYSTKGDWHHFVRYGVARKGETARYFGNVGTPVVFYPGTSYSYTSYFGNPVTIRGANGYSASGQASIFNSDDYLTSNRDELYYQTDKRFNRHITALGAFRYIDERGGSVVPSYGTDRKIERTNFEYTMQLQGDWSNRLFYSVGGAIEKNHLYGVAAEPRIGLAWFPGIRRFAGTKLRANFSKGVSEPALADEFTSLYRQLTPAQIAQFRVTPLTSKRSRTYDIGIDQSLFGNKLVAKLGYFHNMFDHQLDYIDVGTLAKITGQSISSTGIFGAEANTLAYRAQGIEAEVEWKPTEHLFVHGGYTYLDGRVVQSFSTDAAYGGLSTTNPNLPNVPIGSSYPLIGARPFRRPPHSGYAAINYTRRKWGVSAQAAMASRSDDSTFLSYSDINGDNTLLLPNRNLDFGYVKVDAGGTYSLKRRAQLFLQLTNLTNNQHIGPIGYPGLPFSIRAGMKFQLGGK
ncbi:TonB-dependent receptor [Granulicella cerasi]|uniref:TonB-dependent receptor n=2 Tax=Granulicella cerasi TaxID=741063 RepID=A0ABW1ZA41_9BACT